MESLLLLLAHQAAQQVSIVHPSPLPVRAATTWHSDGTTWAAPPCGGPPPRPARRADPLARDGWRQGPAGREQEALQALVGYVQASPELSAYLQAKPEPAGTLLGALLAGSEHACPQPSPTAAAAPASRPAKGAGAGMGQAAADTPSADDARGSPAGGRQGSPCGSWRREAGQKRRRQEEEGAAGPNAGCRHLWPVELSEAFSVYSTLYDLKRQGHVGAAGAGAGPSSLPKPILDVLMAHFARLAAAAGLL